MVRTLLESRSQIYATPDLAGVSDNGGNRINQKLQQVLKKLCTLYPGAEKCVEEEVEATKRSKSTGSGGNSAPKTPTPKKRKMKREVEAHDEDEE